MPKKVISMKDNTKKVHYENGLVWRSAINIHGKPITKATPVKEYIEKYVVPASECNTLQKYLALFFGKELFIHDQISVVQFRGKLIWYFDPDAEPEEEPVPAPLKKPVPKKVQAPEDKMVLTYSTGIHSENFKLCPAGLRGIRDKVHPVGSKFCTHRCTNLISHDAEAKIVRCGAYNDGCEI